MTGFGREPTSTSSLPHLARDTEPVRDGVPLWSADLRVNVNGRLGPHLQMDAQNVCMR